jgi:hypothetical protein
LGYVHRYAYDRQYEPIYRLAQKYDVPVVFHTGDTNSVRAKIKFADPLTIDEVAVDHPKVTFVIAHCGNRGLNPPLKLLTKTRMSISSVPPYSPGTSMGCRRKKLKCTSNDQSPGFLGTLRIQKN